MKWVQDNCMDKRRHEVDVENFFRFNDCKNHLFIFLILSRMMNKLELRITRKDNGSCINTKR